MASSLLVVIVIVVVLLLLEVHEVDEEESAQKGGLHLTIKQSQMNSVQKKLFSKIQIED